MKQQHLFATLLALSAGFIVAPLPLRAAVVTAANEASLRAAIAGGGKVTFGFNGTIKLTQPITIKRNVTVDGTGRNVAISGNNAVRLFNVSTGVHATLIHLTLINGCRLGTNGAMNYLDGSTSDGQSVYGGALYNQGTVNLLSCVFSNNVAIGGANDFWSNSGKAGGGAIYNKAGSLNVTNCTFLTNRAIGGSVERAGSFAWNPYAGEGSGGAIYNEAGRLNVRQCSFSFNTATGGGSLPYSRLAVGTGAAAPGWGGAIHTGGGSVVIQQCIFTANRAVGGDHSSQGSGLGGALSGTNATLTCTESVWLNNRAESGGEAGNGCGYGGAVYCQGEAAFRHCTFTRNSAGAGFFRNGGLGGAVYSQGITTISGCSLADNLATGGIAYRLSPFGISPGGPGWGGGIYCKDKLQITNSTLARNIAQGGDESNSDPFGSVGGEGLGGGLFCASGEVDLVNVTLANNRAVGGNSGIGVTSGRGAGGGIYNTSGTVRLFNTILANSTPGNTNCFGTVHDGGHNLSSDGSCSFTAPGSLNNTDPKLVGLANNGGPTLTMALLPGSPAINAGNSAVGAATDQRGIARPQGAHADIGAFELQMLAVQALAAEKLRLSFAVTPSQACTLQFSTNLVHWTDLTGASAGTNGAARFEVPKNQPVRFFRIKMP